MCPGGRRGQQAGGDDQAHREPHLHDYNDVCGRGTQRPFRLRSSSMPVDPELLEILACPNCKTKVELVKNGTALKCGQCKRVYPIKDDIPVMLLDEATVEP